MYRLSFVWLVILLIGMFPRHAEADFDLPIAEELRPKRTADYPFVYPVTGTVDTGLWQMSCLSASDRLIPCPTGETNFAHTDWGEQGVHTGEDWLVMAQSSRSEYKDVVTINHGVVVYAGPHRAGTGSVVIVKHEAPPERSFKIPPFEYGLCGREEWVESQYVYSYYLHLAPVLAVEQGEQVSKGQRLGVTHPANGLNYPPHLHFEIWAVVRIENESNDAQGYASFGCADCTGPGSNCSFGYLLEGGDPPRGKLVEPRAFIETNNAGPMIHWVGRRNSSEPGVLFVEGKEFVDSAGSLHVSRFRQSGGGLIFNVSDAMWADQLIELPDDLLSTGLVRFDSIDRPFHLSVRRGDTVESNRRYFPFSDVYTEDWFSPYVVRARDIGLVAGMRSNTCFDPRYGGCSFSPLTPIGRAAFLTMVVRGLEKQIGQPLPATGTIPGAGAAGQWFEEILQKAYGFENPNYLPGGGPPESLGIWSDGQPWGREVTRQEACHVLMNALHLPPSRMPVPDFSDVPLGSAYKDWVYVCRDKGLFQGYVDGAFHPNDALTRAQAAKILVKAFSPR